jgi:uncharacterized oxidoreductase
MKPQGNTVLITGGASGIGLALAKLFVDSQNTVIVCGRDQAKLDSARSAISQLITIRVDVSDPASREALAGQVKARFPALNVLINNAGTVNVTDLKDSGFLLALEREVATNFVGPVALTALLTPALISQASALIVNVTTGYVFLPGARTAAYSATKTALHVMTKALRFQLRQTNVRVVEVMPPPIASAMSDHYVGKKGSPEDAAKTIFAGLLRDRQEIVFGVSRIAQLAGRLFPEMGFRMVNDEEEKSAKQAT